MDMRLPFALLVMSLPCLTFCPETEAAPSPDEIRDAMKRAAEYYRGEVAYRGGYVYYYSPDLSRRLGEGVASGEQIWVQPPGTPTVGMAYVTAYEATGDAYYLEAAVEAAEALIYGQLESGAWTNAVDFNPDSKSVGRYRNGKGSSKGKNFSTLDDDISQSALKFMMRLDKATKFENKAVHEAADVALAALLRAQFPNGAFPQGWDETPAEAPSGQGKKGNFPAYDWKTEGRIKEYWDMYTLNDGLALTVCQTLIEAHRIYEREDCLKALKRLGDFFILAQMPEPQPAWAQQYNYDMQPIWARKFEPPAIAGRESEDVVAALMMISEYTGDKKYLQPIPAAVQWLKRSELPGGVLARYYELETNKPLYMSRSGKDYTLTHSDRDLPDHYGWKNESRMAQLKAAWDALQQGQPLPDPILTLNEEKAPTTDQILNDLDDEGRWVSTYRDERLAGQPEFKRGDKYINSGVFSRNLEILSEALRR